MQYQVKAPNNFLTYEIAVPIQGYRESEMEEIICVNRFMYLK